MKQQLCACGRPDCPANLALNEILGDENLPPEVREAIENGDAMVLPVPPGGGGGTLSSLLPLLLGGMPGAEVEMNMMAIGPDGVKSKSIMLGPDGVKTHESVLGPDGKIRGQIRGHRWEQMPDDMIAPEVAAAFAKADEAVNKLEAEEREYSDLRKKVEKDRAAISRTERLLRHDIWEADHKALYGKDGLTVEHGKQGKFEVVNHRGSLAELDAEVGESLMKRQEDLNAKRQEISEAESRISHLRDRMRHEPDKIDALKEHAIEVLAEYQPDLLMKEATGELRIGRQNGKVVFMRRVMIEEETDALPEGMAEDLAKIGNGRRGRKVELPGFLKKILGLPTDLVEDKSPAVSQQ